MEQKRKAQYLRAAEKKYKGYISKKGKILPYKSKKERNGNDKRK